MHNKTVFAGGRNIIKLARRIDSAKASIGYKDELNLSEVIELLKSSDDRITQMFNAYLLGYEAGLHAAESDRPIKGRRHRK